MSDQLIITDELLRVLGAILPSGRIAREIAAARDARGGGELTQVDVRATLDALIAARVDPWCVITRDVVEAAIEHYRDAMSRLVPSAATVSVHVWEPYRDGPEPHLTAARLPEFPAAGRWAV